MERGADGIVRTPQLDRGDDPADIADIGRTGQIDDRGRIGDDEIRKRFARFLGHPGKFVTGGNVFLAKRGLNARGVFAVAFVKWGRAEYFKIALHCFAQRTVGKKLGRSYCQIWCLRDLSCGGGFGLGLLDAVFEIDALDDVGEMIEAAKFAPVLFGALPQFEDHVEHAVAGQTAL